MEAENEEKEECFRLMRRSCLRSIRERVKEDESREVGGREPNFAPSEILSQVAVRLSNYPGNPEVEN